MTYLKSLGLVLLLTLGLAFAQSERPAWQNLELTDVATGETFTLGGFEGKTVYVEPMATWCSNCRKQLGNVAAVKPDAGDEVVFVALSVEGNLPDETLAQYAVKEGFDFTFAVATPELIQALVAEFGRPITSPPSTPHFIIRPDGSTTELKTGFETPEELLAQLAPSQ
ncbi:hypothetical protein BH24DEI2_BH24DEI2_15340 [soil metagenome]